MRVLYIHGAAASSRSFAWLAKRVALNLTAAFFRYELGETLDQCTDRLNNMLTRLDKPVTLVGHSFGGLIAAGASQHPCVKGIVTIGSPINGLNSSFFISLIMSDSLFKDLSPYSLDLKHNRDALKNCGKPYLQIIGTAGIPAIKTENDGVVPVSACVRNHFVPHFFNLNHFELLLDEEVAALIDSFVETVEAAQ